MLKPEFLIKDQKGRNEKKEKKKKRRIPGRRSEESKKEKIQFSSMFTMVKHTIKINMPQILT